MKQPCDQRSGNQKQQNAACGVEFHRPSNRLPYMLSGRAIEDRELAQLAAAWLSDIDDARTMKAEDAVMVSIYTHAQERAVCRRLDIRPNSLPVRRAAQKSLVRVVDLVDVVRRQMQIVLDQHHIVPGVF